MKINSYKEAIANELLEVQHFLEVKGHIKEAITVGSVVDRVSSFQLAVTWLSIVNNA